MKINKLKIASPRIEMLPLIDIVFLLLVFFIYAMLAMAVHHGQKVNLPESSSAIIESQEAIIVSIQDNGDKINIFIAENLVALTVLKELLLDLKEENNRAELEVQIFADQDISYQELFTVMDIIKEAGITKISLQATVSSDHG